MRIINTIIENKSGYERKQERLENIRNYIRKIKLSDKGFDIDGIVKNMIDDNLHVDYQPLFVPIDSECESNLLVKKRNLK